MNVPKLRFPEFRDAGEWIGGILANLIDSLDAGVSVNAEDTPPLRNEYSILKTSCISGNNFNSNERKIVSDTQEIKRLKEQLKSESILVSRMNTPLLVGASAYVNIAPDKTFLPDRLWQLKLSKNVSSYWLASWLSNERNHDSIRATATGTSNSMKNINKSGLLNLEIFYPSLPEQQKIADCLTTLDDRITAETQKLDTLKAHKEGLMQQLFPAEGETLPKLRFPEFRDAGEWEERSIQDLIDKKIIIGHLDGNHGALYPQAEEFSKEGVPYISANDFITGYIDFSKCKYLPVQRALQFKKGVAKDGDILFAHNATVGPVAKLITNFQFVILSTTATYFRCNHKYLVNDFLKSSLSNPSFIGQYTRVMSQSTRNQVPITAQRKFNLQLPALPEQQKIADCLSSLDNLITAQTHKIDTLKTHKKGLMQQLFPALDGVKR